MLGKILLNILKVLRLTVVALSDIKVERSLELLV